MKSALSIYLPVPQNSGFLVAVAALSAFLASSSPVISDSSGNSTETDTAIATHYIKTGENILTLSQCIELALLNNPGISAREWQARSLEAAKKSAMAKRLPQVYMTADYMLFREDRMIKPRRMGDINALGFSAELATTEVVLEMPLYTGGRLRNQVKAAEFFSEAAWKQLTYSSAELVFNVSSLFYSMLEQKKVLGSLEFSRKTLERHHQTMTEMMAAQKAARVDLLRTEVRLADIEQQLLRERNTLDVQRFLLAGLLGVSNEAAHVDIAGELEMPETEINSKSAVNKALSNRQDYRALEMQARAQQMRVNAIRGSRLPEVMLRAAYGNQWGLDNSDANEVGEVGIRVKIPLCTGGSITAEIEREHRLLQAQREALRNAELRIRMEVQSALANMEATRARFDVMSKSVNQAEESLRIEQEKYQLAKGSITDVLDAQSALLTAQTNCHRALADYNTARAQFDLATGSL